MDRSKFFALVRTTLANGSLTQAQVYGIGRILDEWERRQIADTRWLAYMLATVWHETGSKMQPIPEGGGEAYLKAKPYYPWYGRGLVQITWQTNYAKFGISKAEDALTWPVALAVLFDGMTKGMFTGKKLGDYFSDTGNDAISARRIVNGTDKAGLIAGYHLDFLAAITAASAAPAVVSPGPVAVNKPATPPSVSPPAPPAAPALSWWQRLVAALTPRKAA